MKSHLCISIELQDFDLALLDAHSFLFELFCSCHGALN